MGDSYVWIMQYYDRSGDLLTWPEYFKSPDEGEQMVARINRERMITDDVTKPQPINVAWYKELSVYRNERIGQVHQSGQN